MAGARGSGVTSVIRSVVGVGSDTALEHTEEGWMTPTSVTQLMLLLLFVVPGFVYQAVRISVRGRLPLDIELSTRIVRAIVSSGIFALLYLIILGQPLIDAARGHGFGFDHPRLGALLALVGGVVIPSLLALVRVPNWEWIRRLSAALPEVTKYDPTPTAWDKVFQNIGECFIRVLNKENRWIAGYYGAASYATSFPEPHQLYLEKAFHVSDDGTIGDEIEASQGVLIDCTGIQLLQVVAAVEVGEEEPS